MLGKIIGLAVVLLIVAAIAWGPLVSDVEQAKYTVVEKHDAIELRDYAPMIAAQVTVSGDRENAIRDGFRKIADFIFGNNISAGNVAQKIAMTAPVIQQKNEAIAMTAPVTQQSENGQWQVRFVMPSNYTLATLPKPNNAEVILTEISAKRFAAIRFSGMADEASLKQQTELLTAFIAKQNLTALSPATYAFYNPPWTLPFMRRNEVMIEVQK